MYYTLSKLDREELLQGMFNILSCLSQPLFVKLSWIFDEVFDEFNFFKHFIFVYHNPNILLMYFYQYKLNITLQQCIAWKWEPPFISQLLFFVDEVLQRNVR